MLDGLPELAPAVRMIRRTAGSDGVGAAAHASITATASMGGASKAQEPGSDDDDVGVDDVGEGGQHEAPGTHGSQPSLAVQYAIRRSIACAVPTELAPNNLASPAQATPASRASNPFDQAVVPVQVTDASSSQLRERIWESVCRRVPDASGPSGKLARLDDLARLANGTPALWRQFAGCNTIKSRRDADRQMSRAATRWMQTELDQRAPECEALWLWMRHENQTMQLGAQKSKRQCRQRRPAPSASAASAAATSAACEGPAVCGDTASGSSVAVQDPVATWAEYRQEQTRYEIRRRVPAEASTPLQPPSSPLPALQVSILQRVAQRSTFLRTGVAPPMPTPDTDRRLAMEMQRFRPAWVVQQNRNRPSSGGRGGSARGKADRSARTAHPKPEPKQLPETKGRAVSDAISVGSDSDEPTPRASAVPMPVVDLTEQDSSECDAALGKSSNPQRISRTASPATSPRTESSHTSQLAVASPPTASSSPGTSPNSADSKTAVVGNAAKLSRPSNPASQDCNGHATTPTSKPRTYQAAGSVDAQPANSHPPSATLSREPCQDANQTPSQENQAASEADEQHNEPVKKTASDADEQDNEPVNIAPTAQRTKTPTKLGPRSRLLSPETMRSPTGVPPTARAVLESSRPRRTIRFTNMGPYIRSSSPQRRRRGSAAKPKPKAKAASKAATTNGPVVSATAASTATVSTTSSDVSATEPPTRSTAPRAPSTTATASATVHTLTALANATSHNGLAGGTSRLRAALQARPAPSRPYFSSRPPQGFLAPATNRPAINGTASTARGSVLSPRARSAALQSHRQLGASTSIRNAGSSKVSNGFRTLLSPPPKLLGNRRLRVVFGGAGRASPSSGSPTIANNTATPGNTAAVDPPATQAHGASGLPASSAPSGSG